MEQDESTSITQSILFADVAGSTSLYDTIGDTAAQQAIANCLSFMTSICEQHNGTIVKHIGDEILCRFDSALDCINAISNIQSEFKESTQIDTSLRIRAGVNTGPVILKDGDVFGDTVNVAARMAGLAQAEQIICTQDTINAMGLNHGISNRQLDSLFVKGKEEKIQVFEILWSQDDNDLTAFFSAQQVLEQTQEWRLNLTCGERRFQINRNHPNIVMGRSDQCDFVIPSPHASRQHARLISRWGKIVLADQSTNGSYVKLDNGAEIFVHHEELPLSENGQISLGVPAAQNPSDVIRFEYEGKF